MYRIAVTGGIASGKSLFGSCLIDEGVPVCDADDLAHDLMKRGDALFPEIVRAFGADIIDGDGEIDRSALGRRVFADASERARLNAIVHPSVRDAWQEWLSVQSGPASTVIVPLLYEGAFHEGWDAVVCVGAPRDVRLRRVRQRGISEEEAERRLAAQMPFPEHATRADYVVFNSGTQDLLREQARRVLKSILER